MVMWIHSNPFLAIAFASATASVAGLFWYLVRRPALTAATKIMLLFSIGIFPIATAASGNIAGFDATKELRFCGSCHVMAPFRDDALDPTSTSLAARHARNTAFGRESCYACHADYGMYGTLTTKLGGLREFYEHVIRFRGMPIDEFLATVELRKPFPNTTCMRCHSTRGTIWLGVGDHASLLDDLRVGTVSCASAVCHGAAHSVGKVASPRRDRGGPR